MSNNVQCIYGIYSGAPNTPIKRLLHKMIYFVYTKLNLFQPTTLQKISFVINLIPSDNFETHPILIARHVILTVL